MYVLFVPNQISISIQLRNRWAWNGLMLGGKKSTPWSCLLCWNSSRCVIRFILDCTENLTTSSSLHIDLMLPEGLVSRFCPESTEHPWWVPWSTFDTSLRALSPGRVNVKWSKGWILNKSGCSQNIHDDNVAIMPQSHFHVNLSCKCHARQISWKKAGHRPCNCHEIATSHSFSQTLSYVALTGWAFTWRYDSGITHNPLRPTVGYLS